MTTTTAQRLTISKDSNALSVRCRGANHHDYATLGMCDNCGCPMVAITDDGRIVTVNTNRNGYCCWNRHECDPEQVAEFAAMQAERAAAGEIIKGCTVTVVRGRKVAHGTTGTVCWIGQDSYGKARIGMRVDGQTVFTATSNVEVTA